MLSLYKMEIFAAVVHEGSFSRAAQRLYMTQPAVSQHIQSLEAGLGVKLFRRGQRGVVLTPPGETLYEYTQRILKLVAEAESAVTQVENLASGQIQIGATPGVAVYLLPDWVNGFRARYPNLSTTLQTDITPGISAGILSSRLELGFVEGELESSNPARLASIPLQEIELFVVVGRGHEWCQREDVAMQEINGQPFITRQPRSRTRIWIDETLQRFQVQPRIVGEFDNPESIKQAVMSNMGVTILPDYAIHRERENRLLSAIPIRDEPLRRELKLIWDADVPFSPVTRAFLQYMAGIYPAIHAVL